MGPCSASLLARQWLRSGFVVYRTFLFGRRKHGDLTHTLTTTNVDFFVGRGRGGGRGGGSGGGRRCSFCFSSTTVLFGVGTQTTTDDQPHLQRHQEQENSRTGEQENRRTGEQENRQTSRKGVRCWGVFTTVYYSLLLPPTPPWKAIFAKAPNKALTHRRRG